MNVLSLELAFSRFGANVAGRQRLLCATAQDGSLVMVCQSSGFSRPGAGVLRYSASLSKNPAPRSHVEDLRAGLVAASSGSTPVRLIIQTPAVSRGAKRVHMRADLVGSVTAFDGDAYDVDFVRLPVEEPEQVPAPRTRRKR
jgi:hypothetical protein